MSTKEYILYNHVTGEYLTRVIFNGGPVYKTTTLNFAVRFTDEDKEQLEALGASNPDKVLTNIEATAFGSDDEVKETYKISNLSFLSINDMTPEERIAFERDIEAGIKRAASLHCCSIIRR